jgi:peptidoglycan-associated lipoprotein
MKKTIILMGIFVLFIFGMAIFTGCSENKAVVTKETPQETTPVQTVKETPDTVKQEDVSSVNQNAPVAEPPVQVKELALPKDSLRDINFDFDSSVIRPDAREILKANADLLKKTRLSFIVIEGHCDEKGTDEYNMALGQRRAQEAKQYLINLGVKESLIRTVSYGEERPLDTEQSEEAWAKNRRAHFAVMQ